MCFCTTIWAAAIANHCAYLTLLPLLWEISPVKSGKTITRLASH